MNTHIWYFEESGRGIAVKNVTYFDVLPSGIVFHFINGQMTTIRNEMDVENFKKNILKE